MKQKVMYLSIALLYGAQCIDATTHHLSSALMGICYALLAIGSASRRPPAGQSDTAEQA
jgi:hypothetical protein